MTHLHLIFIVALSISHIFRILHVLFIVAFNKYLFFLEPHEKREMFVEFFVEFLVQPSYNMYYGRCSGLTGEMNLEDFENLKLER